MQPAVTEKARHREICSLRCETHVCSSDVWPDTGVRVAMKVLRGCGEHQPSVDYTEIALGTIGGARAIPDDLESKN